MTLYDQIIDECENLAANRILIEPTECEIVDAISEIVNVKLGYNSTGARLAIASFRRMENVVNSVRSVLV